MATITVQQAAEKLGISERRVCALIAAERLPAKRFGKSWAIDSSDLRRVRHRPVGRPKSSKSK